MSAQAIIDTLNSLLEAELIALEYYRIHAAAIAEKDIAEGVAAILPAEQSHAVNLAERIRKLGGVPVDPSEGAVERGREMGEKTKKQGTLGMLRFELEQEQEAIKAYAGPVADIVDDMTTLEILEEQLLDEMRHAKWLKQRILALKGVK